MDFGLTGRTALVVASTSGLGRATAEALALEGANVVVCGRRGELAATLAGALPRAIGMQVDITAPNGPADLVKTALDAFGAVDICVLNGPGPRPGSAAEVTGEEVSQSVHTSLLPHYRLISLVLGGMRQRQWGRIVAIGSSGVQAPLPDLALSNAVRAALAAHLKTLAGEVAADGVTVNMLLPGRIATARVRQLDALRAQQEGCAVEEMEAASRARIPVGRYGRPEEFAAVGAFLCSDRASYITGTALRVDGGLLPFL